MSAAIEQVTNLPRLAPRNVDAHKGDFGRVLVVAGIAGMHGAAVLCGSAALRGGAGLVTVVCFDYCSRVITSCNPCLMTFEIEDGDINVHSYIAPQLGKSDVVVVGPGIGQSEMMACLVNRLTKTTTLPIVFDADALNVLECSSDNLGQHAGPRILTPHPGEFARLIGTTTAEVQSHREKLTIEFAKRFGVVLALKGHETLVCDGNRLYRNTTGNPGMATAGSGDVLAGLIGALVGQGLRPFEAAQLGVFLHGRAGDLARDHFGEVSLIASDLLDYLPMAFQSL